MREFSGMKTKINLMIIMFFLLLAPAAGSTPSARSLEISGAIIQIAAFLLAMCGSLFLASGLWIRGEKGSESWKYLSISMIMFAVWNVIMAFGLMIGSLMAKSGNDTGGVFENLLNIINVLDPVIEVVVFMILLFGMQNIIKMMRTKPWAVFGKEGSDE